MCWITLNPTKPKHKSHGHDHHHHHSERGSSVEELIRISRSTIVDTESGRNARIRVLSPARISVPTVEVRERYSQHLHPHFPHHLHPHHQHHHHHIRLHGHGKKRAPPPGPPPPSRCPSQTREPIYRTQVVEPSNRDREIRETTRIALREVRPQRDRGRLRRVAGYEVLGRDVPWSWDAVSSVASGGGRSRTGSRRGLKFPPFGGAGSWM